MFYDPQWLPYPPTPLSEGHPICPSLAPEALDFRLTHPARTWASELQLRSWQTAPRRSGPRPWLCPVGPDAGASGTGDQIRRQSWPSQWGPHCLEVWGPLPVPGHPPGHHARLCPQTGPLVSPARPGLWARTGLSVTGSGGRPSASHCPVRRNRAHRLGAADPGSAHGDGRTSWARASGTAARPARPSGTQGTTPPGRGAPEASAPRIVPSSPTPFPKKRGLRF